MHHIVIRSGREHGLGQDTEPRFDEVANSMDIGRLGDRRLSPIVRLLERGYLRDGTGDPVCKGIRPSGPVEMDKGATYKFRLQKDHAFQLQPGILP
jgi:hypothetical protein